MKFKVGDLVTFDWGERRGIGLVTHFDILRYGEDFKSESDRIVYTVWSSLFKYRVRGYFGDELRLLK